MHDREPAGHPAGAEPEHRATERAHEHRDERPDRALEEQGGEIDVARGPIEEAHEPGEQGRLGGGVECHFTVQLEAHPAREVPAELIVRDRVRRRLRREPVHREEVDRRRDVLLGQRALVLVSCRSRGLGGDPHDVEMQRVHVAVVTPERRAANGARATGPRMG